MSKVLVLDEEAPLSEKDIEERLIACLIRDPNSIPYVSSRVVKEDFATPAHAILYEKVVNSFNSNTPFTVDTVSCISETSSSPGSDGDVSFLWHRVLSTECDLAMIKSYTRQVIHMSIRRLLEGLSTEILESSIPLEQTGEMLIDISSKIDLLAERYSQLL